MWAHFRACLGGGTAAIRRSNQTTFPLNKVACIGQEMNLDKHDQARNAKLTKWQLIPPSCQNVNSAHILSTACKHWQAGATDAPPAGNSSDGLSYLLDRPLLPPTPLQCAQVQAAASVETTWLLPLPLPLAPPRHPLDLAPGTWSGLLLRLRSSELREPLRLRCVRAGLLNPIKTSGFGVLNPGAFFCCPY
jgi:hypothetical protein